MALRAHRILGGRLRAGLLVPVPVSVSVRAAGQAGAVRTERRGGDSPAGSGLRQLDAQPRGVRAAEQGAPGCRRHRLGQGLPQAASSLTTVLSLGMRRYQGGS